jgi:uncharacterized repeat protein (TIGR01451 family)
VRVALAIGLVAAILAPSGTVLAQGTLTLSTPYPGVSVQPGASASFDLKLTSSEPRFVDLAVSGAPTGWTASLHGGGFTVTRVFVSKDDTPELKLDVKVPEDAADGRHEMTVTATGGGQTSTVAVVITVAAQAGGSVSFTTDIADKKGRSDQAQTFNLTLHNDTPQQLTFTLNTQGGPGTEDWKIEATPSGQAQAASFSVDAGSTEGVTVTVTPGAGAASNKYPVLVQAVSGNQTAEQQLSVEITGNVTLGLAAQQGQPLSTTATAGGGKAYTLVLSNTGTSPATNVTVTGSGPTGWNVTFDGQTSFKVDSLAAGTSQNVVATITPSSDAIAGDYIVTFNGASAEGSKSVDVRVTVETSPVWLIVGIAIIVLVIGGLLYVFQRYGRR